MLSLNLGNLSLHVALRDKVSHIDGVCGLVARIGLGLSCFHATIGTCCLLSSSSFRVFGFTSCRWGVYDLFEICWGVAGSLGLVKARLVWEFKLPRPRTSAIIEFECCGLFFREFAISLVQRVMEVSTYFSLLILLKRHSNCNSFDCSTWGIFVSTLRRGIFCCFASSKAFLVAFICRSFPGPLLTFQSETWRCFQSTPEVPTIWVIGHICDPSDSCYYFSLRLRGILGVEKWHNFLWAGGRFFSSLNAFRKSAYSFSALTMSDAPASLNRAFISAVGRLWSFVLGLFGSRFFKVGSTTQMQRIFDSELITEEVEQQWASILYI